MAKAAECIVLRSGEVYEVCEEQNCPKAIGCLGKDENRGTAFVCNPGEMAKAAKIKPLTRAQSAQLRNLKFFV